MLFRNAPNQTIKEIDLDECGVLLLAPTYPYSHELDNYPRSDMMRRQAAAALGRRLERQAGPRGTTAMDIRAAKSSYCFFTLSASAPVLDPKPGCGPASPQNTRR